ncbi:hypothetical protein IJ103_01440, partial [Candidatus Saccharibacteria bacterium]|nr:hypothetical protein [Candidatus Saccharibacteria bacterium]
MKSKVEVEGQAWRSRVRSRLRGAEAGRKRRAHRDAGAGRGRTHSGLVATLLLVAAVGATSFVVYLANNGSAKRFA